MSNYRTGFNNGALGIGLPIYDLSEGRLDKPNQVVFDTTKPHPNYNTKDGEGGYPRFALDVNGNIKLTGAVLNKNGDLQQLKQDISGLPIKNDDILDSDGIVKTNYEPPNMIDDDKNFRIDGTLHTTKFSTQSKINVIAPSGETVILDVSNAAFRQPILKVNFDDDAARLSTADAPGIDISGNVKIDGNMAFNLDSGESNIPADHTLIIRKTDQNDKNIIKITEKGIAFNKPSSHTINNSLEIPNNIVIGETYIKDKVGTYDDSMLVQGRVGIQTDKPIFPLYVDDPSGVRAIQYVERSDIRLKSNVQTIKSSLEKINKLNGVSYKNKYLEDGQRYIGFIAQDVEKTVPEVIYEVEPPEQDKFKTIKYNGLISLLIEGVKELTKRVETCENKLNNKQ